MNFTADDPQRVTSLIDGIRDLQNAEVAHLANQADSATTFSRMMHQYMRYVVHTWGNVFRNMVSLTLNPIDFIVALIYAFSCSFILGFALLLCAMLKLLPSQALLAALLHTVNRFGLKMCNPMHISRHITQSQVDSAGVALAKPPTASKFNGERRFDIDIAKLLLQFSALMYERGREPVLAAIAAARAQPSPETSGPGHATKDERLYRVHAKDHSIRNFCRTFGLEYTPVSELNSSDSAYAALFWDPNSSWIVVAFKGTSPAEYPEWVSDFSYELMDAGDWLPGFSQVHSDTFCQTDKLYVNETPLPPLQAVSFNEFSLRTFRILEVLDPGVREFLLGSFAYPIILCSADTITMGIRRVAKSLRQKFTGHSLGSAIASLAYARAVLVEKDLGEDVVLRDGYIFAAPIVCDVASVRAFDCAINKSYDMPQTLWRITNMRDYVATGLPDFGDTKHSRFIKNSLLNFAHLGAEIRMRSKPVPSLVSGWPHITRGLPVLVTSSFPTDLVGTVGKDNGLSPAMLCLQRLPFFGRFFQHAPRFYWDQLERVGLGPCQWVKDI